MRSVRVVESTGDRLLQPNCSPIIPPDILDGELVLVVPPVPPWRPADAIEAIKLRKTPKLFSCFDDRYWRLAENNQHPTDTLFAWVNDPGPGMPVVGFGCGVDRAPQIAEFKFKPNVRKNGLPDYWHIGGLIVLSSRVLELLLDIDSEAIVYRPIEMRNLDDAVFDRDHYLVDVVRTLPAVDYANSVVEYYGPVDHGGERLPARVSQIWSARFRNDLQSGFHIFRQSLTGDSGFAMSSCFVSNQLKLRLEKLRPKPRNMTFAPLYEGA